MSKYDTERHKTNGSRDTKTLFERRRRNAMTFSVDAAFERLREEGDVVSARASDYDTRPVWIRRGRGEDAEFYARRAFLGVVEWDRFRREVAAWFSDMAGFPNAEAWVEAAREVHRGAPNLVRLYYVRREDSSEEVEA